MAETSAGAPRLKRRAVLSAVSQVVFLSLPFVSAGTVHWTRGWIWLAVGLLSMAAYLCVVRLKNPGLVRTRLATRMPGKPFDKAFMLLYMVSATAFIVIAGLDARWGWSHVAFGWVYAGIVLHVASLIPFFAAAATNPYLEGTVRIQNERGHVVVTSGPYAIVRHPMYAGVPLMYFAWPLIFGSLWDYIPAVVIAILFVFRTAHEDRMLKRELPGYEEYAQRTRYRLIPGLW